MTDYLTNFFDTSDFPPRWYCGNWSEFLGWLHIVSDLATFAAYFAIPAVLFHFARKRRDFPFIKLFWLFGAFILACGTVHLIEATLFWYPIYRISGAMKFVTAVVSWGAVIALIQYAPRLMAIPSLAATNQRLRVEIQQRMESQQGLQRLTARYEALLSGTRSIIWTTDAGGQFATDQESWTRFTGQAYDEHRGFGFLDAVHEDDREDLTRRWQHARDKKMRYRAVYRLWNAETSSFRRSSSEAMPVLDGNSEVIEWIGTNTDIEDQSAAEFALGIARSELSRQKEELELIYESAPVGMCLIDRDFRFMRINETLAKINGFARESHLGQRADELLPDLDDQLKPIYEQVFTTGQPVLDIEITGTTPASSKPRTWLGSYFPLKDHSLGSDGSAVTAVNAIVQDITDRKSTEIRLRESEQSALAANQSKSEFLANMSHEIRTPMAAILGYADVLLGHLKDPDNRNCVLVIKRNGQFLLELINDILDLSRIEAGKMDVEIEECELASLVSDIDSLMQVRASEKQIDLNAKFTTPVPATIETDTTRLRQVLINLIGNAIKFTEKGSVRLEVGIENQQLNFVVHDTGIGMSPEQQDRLFKPFSQGDSSVTRQYGGSGLGLAISRRLSSMLGGQITAESEVDKGSKFRLTLPIELPDDALLVKPAIEYQMGDKDDQPQYHRTLSCRILVVDDRRDVRHISQHFLEKAGATVSTAEDGQQGVDAAIAARDAGKPFDLIVMDMQMPKVDGLQATAELRTVGMETPIIALTADAMKGDREKCLNGGCDDYLSKPIDHIALVNIVARYTQDMTTEEIEMRRQKRIAALRASLSDEVPETNSSRN